MLDGTISAGELVPVRPERRALLVPAHQHRLVLEPVPAGPLGERAGLRPDRRRAARRPDGRTSRSSTGRADRVPRVDFATTARNRCWTASTYDRGRARRSRWSATPARASRALGKLVARFYEFQGGEILVDGRDIRTLDLADYRRQLGIVPQTPFLFAGTVARQHPLRAGPDATDDEVDAGRRAASAAATGWRRCRTAWQTEVGEGGRGISLGQRQLVALARVLLQDPAIIILDEATASVDPLTEAQIQEGLDIVLQDRTAIVIAHRLSTIRTADRIIVLRAAAAIIEEGSHDALMLAGGHYAELYNTYFRHQSPDYQPGQRVRAGGPGAGRRAILSADAPVSTGFLEPGPRGLELGGCELPHLRVGERAAKPGHPVDEAALANDRHALDRLAMPQPELEIVPGRVRFPAIKVFEMDQEPCRSVLLGYGVNKRHERPVVGVLQFAGERETSDLACTAGQLRDHGYLLYPAGPSSCFAA